MSETIKVGRIASSPLFSLRIGRRGAAAARAAVVVSSKVAKTAVARNKMKRRLRAILTPLLPQMEKGINLVVFAKKEGVAAPFAELRVEIELQMEKL